MLHAGWNELLLILCQLVWRHAAPGGRNLNVLETMLWANSRNFHWDVQVLTGESVVTS